MFIYFPEFAYKRAKSFLYHSFNNKLNEKVANEVIEEKLREEKIKNIVKSFKENRIRFPIISNEHCFPFINTPELISNYDKIENKINICKNYVEDKEHFAKLLKKEISHAYEFNINKRGSNLNDFAIMSINACRIQCENINPKFENELVKRCAFLELKNKFGDKIKQHSEYQTETLENLKLNEIVNKLIDQNLIK